MQKSASNSGAKDKKPDVIELDDEEEEINDVEDDEVQSGSKRPSSSAMQGSPSKKSNVVAEDSGEEGVEEIEDEEPEDD